MTYERVDDVDVLRSLTEATGDVEDARHIVELMKVMGFTVCRWVRVEHPAGRELDT